MKYTTTRLTCLFMLLAACFGTHAQDTPLEQKKPKPKPSEKEKPLVCPEPSFKERQWEKKKIKASERIDQIITALLIPAFANSITSKFWLNQLPQSIKNHHGAITGSLLATKMIVTFWRMHLHDLYVGSNPLKLIPATIYFTLVDMASWRLK